MTTPEIPQAEGEALVAATEACYPETHDGVPGMFTSAGRLTVELISAASEQTVRLQKQIAESNLSEGFAEGFRQGYLVGAAAKEQDLRELLQEHLGIESFVREDTSEYSYLEFFDRWEKERAVRHAEMARARP